MKPAPGEAGVIARAPVSPDEDRWVEPSSAASVEEVASRAVARPSPPLQRCDGLAELRVAAHAGIHRLAHLHQIFPCRLLFPDVAAGEPPLAVWTVLSDGLAGGDRLRLKVDVGRDAALSITTQAAERVYRSNGPDCDVATRLTIAPGAWLDWTPRPTILFDGARLRRRATISIATGGRLLACDGIVFGRVARGESYRRGALLDRWRIDRDGKPLWVDALRLDDPAAALAAPAGLDGARALATAVYVGDDAPKRLEDARALLADSEERAGVTVVNGVLLARFMGETPAAVQRDLVRYLGGLRRLVGPYSEVLPRVGND